MEALFCISEENYGIIFYVRGFGLFFFQIARPL